MNMKHNKINNLLLYSVVIILGLLFTYFIKDIISKDQEKKELYNDFSRANQVMALSFNKDFSTQFAYIREAQASLPGPKLSKGELIYDLASHNFIPILNYLDSISESDKLIAAVSDVMDFIQLFNIATIGLRENVLIKQSDGKYYALDNAVYIYKTKKDYISKTSFQNLYFNYMENQSIKSLESNFISRLLKEPLIIQNYTRNSLIKEVNNNYSYFFEKNKDSIIKVISEDLIDFSNYLHTYIETFPQSNKQPLLKKDIETKSLELTWKFTRLQRVYVDFTKHLTHSFQLDIDYIWYQLNELNIPKLMS